MNWKRYLPIIGLAIFVYILIKINLVTIFQEIADANLFYIFIAGIFTLFMLVTQTFKWFVIARSQKIKIGFKDAFVINLITDFYDFIIPAKLATIMRVEYLKKYAETGKGLCNFVLDKVMDLSSIVFIVILFSFVFKDKLDIPVSFFAAVFVIFILATLFFLKKERTRFVFRIFYRKIIPEKMKKDVRMTFDSFYDHMPKKRYFVVFFFLNLLNWIVLYSISYFIGIALGINLPFYYFLAILPLGTLITLIPISINGLGTKEATLISIFSLFGISAAKVFSMSILGLFFAGIIPAIIASFLMFKYK